MFKVFVGWLGLRAWSQALVPHCTPIHPSCHTILVECTPDIKVFHFKRNDWFLYLTPKLGTSSACLWFASLLQSRKNRVCRHHLRCERDRVCVWEHNYFFCSHYFFILIHIAHKFHNGRNEHVLPISWITFCNFNLLSIIYLARSWFSLFPWQISLKDTIICCVHWRIWQHLY